MAQSGTNAIGVDNTFRKKFDREEYLERARRRILQEQQHQQNPHPPVPRVPLKHRDYQVDLESHLGKTQVVTPIAPLSQQAGFFCSVCDCVVKDSLNFLDHINGKKHQRKLGMSMRVERASLTQVQQRLKKRSVTESFTEKQFDERVLKQLEDEEERKRQRRERKKEKKREKAMEEGVGIEDDPDIAEIMGFGGFATTKK